MKKLLSLFAAFALVLTLAGCGEKEVTSQTFKATAKGFGGDVTCELTLEDKTLTKVVFTGENETENIGSTVIDTFGNEMVKRNKVDIDVLSGATITSNAAIKAATDCLSQAGLKPSDLVEKEIQTEIKDETVTADIVVVGAGGAGMTAAIKAKEAGVNVVVLDKAPMVGGNTTRATGGMNASETEQQKALNSPDTIAQFIEDTMVGGKNLNDPALVEVLCNNAKDEIKWLESIGANLPVVGSFGGATYDRIHKPEGGAAVGPYLVDVFSKNIKDMNIPLYLNTEATELITENGKVVGVKAKSADTNYTFNAKAVILATGGFAYNFELCASLNPDLEGFISTNVPYATGDGIKMAQAIGAATVDMEQIQTHPTVHPSSEMITEGVRGDGAILINLDGKRFVNEMDTRDVVSKAILAQKDAKAYLVFADNLRQGQKAVEKYVNGGLTIEANTLEELANKLGVDANNLVTTANTYNTLFTGATDEFGRTTGLKKDLQNGPYYAIEVAPALHHTMGGLKINTNAEVLNTNGEVIEGLYAAGEVTGGVHGANRLGGNAVADIVVFGSVAAESASEYVK